MHLRPYQAECKKSVFEAFEHGDSALMVLPTGTGKTHIFAHVIKDWLQRYPGRIGVMAHREELVTQNANVIERVTGYKPIIEMAKFEGDGDFFDLDSRIICTSVQSMCQERRLKKYNPHDFTLWITDEAHHCVPTNRSYNRIIEHFCSDGSLKHLGCTATPDRADELALGQMYETVAFEYDLPTAIKDGWLVPIRQQYINIQGLDLDKVNNVAGDFNQGQLEMEMMKDENFHTFVSAILSEAGTMPTLVFTVDVAHAEKTDHFLNQYRHEVPELISVCIHGKTNKDLRRKWVDEFQKRLRQFMVSCGVFLEGFDAPVAQVAAMGRPTQSRSLFAQALGRCTRPLPGIVDNPLFDAQDRKEAIAISEKPFCLSLDFVGNCYKHKLISTADILGGKYDDEIVEEAAKMAKATGGPVDMETTLEEAEKKVKERKQHERLKVLAKARYTRTEVSPFDVLDVACTREPGWHKGRKITEGQAKALKNFGVDDPNQYSFWQAHNLLDSLISRANEGRATFKQTRLLRKFGESADVSFEEASRIITEIRNRGWQPRETASVL